MRKFSIIVNHYWAKTANFKYGGEVQQLAMEIGLAALLLPITIYCYLIEGLQIFFVAFILPTIILIMAACLTSYYIIKGYIERRNNKQEKEKT